MGISHYLAMTGVEIAAAEALPENIAYMACHFSPYGTGLTGPVQALPPQSMLILNDRIPFCGHDIQYIGQQLAQWAADLHCSCLLLDFQRPPVPESEQMVQAIVSQLPCSAAFPPAYAQNWDGPVFLPPCPLHVPLEEYLEPWKGREIWLEAALCQETINIIKDGPVFTPQFPPEGLDGGFFDDGLCCQYTTHTSPEEISFTLFDTRESLLRKLEKAHSLGVTRAVGLYQELG